MRDISTRIPAPARYVLSGILSFLAINLFYQVLVLDGGTSVVLGVLAAFAVAWYLTRDRMRSIIGATCAVPIFAPFFFPAYDMSQIVVLGLIAIGLNVVTGYAGQISLGHGALVAVGGYTTAILMHDHGWAWWQTLLVAAVITAIVGFIVGLPSLRLSGPYLAMATLALAIVLPIAAKAKRFEGFTHGVQGILIRKPKPPGWIHDTLGLNLSQDQYLYFLSVLVAIAGVYLTYRLLRSRHGRAFLALRDSEVAAQVMGISLARYKTTAFAASAFLAGLGGTMYALTVGFVSPDSFSLLFSLSFLVMIVMGGLESIIGSVIGAAVIWELSLKVQTIKFHQLGMHAEFSPWIVYGTVLVLVMIFMPYGIAGFFYRLPQSRFARWARRLQPRAAAKDAGGAAMTTEATHKDTGAALATGGGGEQVATQE